MSTGVGMTGVISPAGAPAREHGAATDAQLRRACAELEGVFLNELFKLMRETVPQGGVVSGGTAEEIFTSLLDQHLAVSVAERLDRGIGAALYRSFRAAVQPPAGEAGEP